MGILYSYTGRGFYVVYMVRGYYVVYTGILCSLHEDAM